MSGFLISSLAHKYEKEFYDVVPGMIKRGEIKFIEDRTMGLENVSVALREWQPGKECCVFRYRVGCNLSVTFGFIRYKTTIVRSSGTIRFAKV